MIIVVIIMWLGYCEPSLDSMDAVNYFCAYDCLFVGFWGLRASYISGNWAL